jgi:hypothetical protein
MELIMKKFTFKPEIENNSIFSSYLTAKDRKTTKELAAQILNAKTDSEIELIASHIVRRAQRNQIIDKHERIMSIVRMILTDLENDSYFRLYSLGDAIAHMYDTLCYDHRKHEYIMPLGAIRTVINEMLNEGILEIKYVKYYGSTVKAYHKK